MSCLSESNLSAGQRWLAETSPEDGSCDGGEGACDGDGGAVGVFAAGAADGGAAVAVVLVCAALVVVVLTRTRRSQKSE